MVDSKFKFIIDYIIFYSGSIYFGTDFCLMDDPLYFNHDKIYLNIDMFR
jgi:hypothetical protein